MTALSRRDGARQATATTRIIALGTAAAFVGILVLVMAGVLIGGFKAVPVDKVALHYTGGPIQGQHFKEVVQPGTGTRFYGLLESLYELPATQRNYIISKNPHEGDVARPDFIAAPSLDKVEIDWEIASYFKLNTDPQVVRRFFEQICLKYHCTDLSPDGGWDHMLADNFRQQIVASIQQESRQYTSDDLYSNKEVLLKVQREVGSSLKERVNDVLGGEFFCGPTFTASRPHDCPDFTFVVKAVSVPRNIQDQYNQNRASALAVETTKNQAAQKRIEAEGEAAKQNALRQAQSLDPAQIDFLRAQAELECAKNPNCTLVVTNGNGNVNVNAGKR